MKFEAKNLSCVRGKKYLFRNLNFTLCPGQLLWVQGHNGAGKSSLLKILAGLMMPDKGAVIWNEFLSYLGHKDGIKKVLTVKENLLQLLALGQASCLLETHAEILHKLNLTALMDKPCQQLSAGQQRKVALASIIMNQKKLWILDEPLSSLDKNSVCILQTFFDNHLNEGGMIIMVSHLPLADKTQNHLIDLSAQELPC